MGKYLTGVAKSFIEENLRADPKVRNVFDAGGGSGRFAIPLGQKGYKVTLSEVDIKPLRALKRKLPNVPAILVGKDIQSFPFKDRAFDCILCIQDPWYTERSNWFFAECNRLLKGNGILIFTIINKNSYKALFRWVVLKRYLLQGKWWAALEYRKSFTDIRKHIEVKGFRLLRAKGYSWIPYTYSSKGKFISLFVALEKLLRLDLLVSVSPRLIIKARKVSDFDYEGENNRSNERQTMG